MVLVFGMLASPAGWAWNPYDTDSSWSAPAPADWSAPDRWRDDSRDSAEGVDRTWRQPDRGRARFAGSESLETRGYEFRHDPKLDAQPADQRNGWQFRPRSEREQARSVAENHRYPRLDEREYRPRGPWHSYQDEGTAFGYHAEDPWSDGSTQSWPR